jgi:hypothetical protein
LLVDGNAAPLGPPRDFSGGLANQTFSPNEWEKKIILLVDKVVDWWYMVKLLKAHFDSFWLPGRPIRFSRGLGVGKPSRYLVPEGGQ